MTTKQGRASVAIVGGGRVGTTLGYLLNKRGYKIEAVLCRSLDHAQRAVRFIGAGQPATDLAAIPSQCRLLLVTTPDGQIEGVARKLSDLKLSWKQLTVLHCSGYLSSDALWPLKALGAAVGSMHPLQTFAMPDAAVKTLSGSFFALEGDRSAIRIGKQLVADLGGIAVRIPGEGKPIYHCAAALACGHLAALISVAVDTMQQAGVRKQTARRLLYPLVEQTVQNSFHMSLDQALTGPIARGDIQTVKRHLQELKRLGDSNLKIYKLLGRKILDAVAEHNGLPSEKIAALARLLR